MKEITTNSDGHHCKNCKQPISENAKYCSSCGQKNTDGRISVASFFNSFFSTIFNLESKLFKTLGHIFVPGKLTLEYFKGKHKRYFHPVRLFIVSALILIAALGYQLPKEAMNIANIYKKAENQVLQESLLSKVDKVAQQTLDKFPNNSTLESAFDTLYQTLKGNNIDEPDSVDMSKSIVSSEIDKLDFKVSNADLVNLSTEQLVDKYKVENRFDRFVLKQKLRLIKEKGGFAPFVLGNSLWISLLMMPFLALILKILYSRKDYYFVEHLVFTFHIHAFAFLLFGLIGFLILLKAPSWLIAVGFVILFLYLYKALRKVYGQGRFITVVKLLIVNFVYLFLFAFFLAFGLIASMAIF